MLMALQSPSNSIDTLESASDIKAFVHRYEELKGLDVASTESVMGRASLYNEEYTREVMPFVFADFNGDGLRDLLVYLSDSEQLYPTVFLGSNTGVCPLAIAFLPTANSMLDVITVEGRSTLLHFIIEMARKEEGSYEPVFHIDTLQYRETGFFESTPVTESYDSIRHLSLSVIAGDRFLWFTIYRKGDPVPTDKPNHPFYHHEYVALAAASFSEVEKSIHYLQVEQLSIREYDMLHPIVAELHIFYQNGKTVTVRDPHAPGTVGLATLYRNLEQLGVR